MKPTVYLETTFISYLTARPSRDLLVAGHQQVTRDWWEQCADQYDLHASEVVTSEAGSGDKGAAEKRLEALQSVSFLELTEEVRALARELLRRKAVPREAEEDALHIAVAAVHGMDYLLTWNCAHIANARMKHAIEAVCLSLGYEAPVICTPEELMGD
jgi:predicted nucleic acid-binding protein